MDAVPGAPGSGTRMQACRRDTPLEPSRKARKTRDAPAEHVPPPDVLMRSRTTARAEVDLHGLTVEEALTRSESAINDALLADLPSLRLIHGRSSGRIRAALHRRLRDIAAVRAFRLEPGNDGVTVVTF